MYTLTLYHKMLLFQRKRTKKELWGEGDWELPQNLKGVKESLSQTLFLPLSNIAPGESNLENEKKKARSF